MTCSRFVADGLRRRSTAFTRKRACLGASNRAGLGRLSRPQDHKLAPSLSSSDIPSQATALREKRERSYTVARCVGLTHTGQVIRTRWLGFVLVATAAACLPGSASALVVPDSVQGSVVIKGAGCGQSGVGIVRMPPKTHSARIISPTAKIGTELSSDNGLTVARWTQGTIVRDARGFSAQFTATGSDDACARPYDYPAGWVGRLEYYVNVRRSVQAYASTNCGLKHVSRPRAIRVDCSKTHNLSVYRLHWKTWAGKTARGSGSVRINDCKPTCARGTRHRYRASVALSRARNCGPWLYRRMTISFPRAHPAKLRRGHRYSFGFGYCPS
jgi:hypothetical protein